MVVLGEEQMHEVARSIASRVFHSFNFNPAPVSRRSLVAIIKDVANVVADSLPRHLPDLLRQTVRESLGWQSASPCAIVYAWLEILLGLPAALESRLTAAVGLDLTGLVMAKDMVDAIAAAENNDDNIWVDRVRQEIDRWQISGLHEDQEPLVILTDEDFQLSASSSAESLQGMCWFLSADAWDALQAVRSGNCLILAGRMSVLVLRPANQPLNGFAARGRQPLFRLQERLHLPGSLLIAGAGGTSLPNVQQGCLASVNGSMTVFGNLDLTHGPLQVTSSLTTWNLESTGSPAYPRCDITAGFMVLVLGTLRLHATLYAGTTPTSGMVIVAGGGVSWCNSIRTAWLYCPGTTLGIDTMALMKGLAGGGDLYVRRRLALGDAFMRNSVLPARREALGNLLAGDLSASGPVSVPVVSSGLATVTVLGANNRLCSRTASLRVLASVFCAMQGMQLITEDNSWPATAQQVDLQAALATDGQAPEARRIVRPGRGRVKGGMA